MEIILIAAVAQNRVIGNKGALPWYIPADLQRFKKLTTGHPVIMGRKTYESILKRIGKPLPDRLNIVLTSQKNYAVAPGVILASSFNEAIEKVKNESIIYVIGGRQVYEDALPKATTLEMTHVHQDYEGDALFPEINKEIWKEESRENHSESDIKYSFARYKKKDGLFVTFEGIDGCGKSTQIRKLVQHIFEKNKHNNIILTRNPYKDVNMRAILHQDTDPLSQSDKLADLFINDRKKQVEEIITPNLKNGHFVVSDRYKLSTIAYQSAQGLDMQDLIKRHEGLPIPDLTFIIDVSAEEAFIRMSKESVSIRGKEHKFEANIDFIRKVRENYLKIKEILKDENIQVINGERNADEIFEDVKKTFDQVAR